MRKLIYAYLVYDALPLGFNSFRLIRLYPAPDFSSPLLITLLVADFDRSDGALGLPYDAISYTWGSCDDMSLIWADDKQLRITKSAESALRHLRGDSAERILWIDSICINQSNVAERNQQVMKMGQIFSSAECVRIWLGPEADDSETALKLVQDATQDTFSRGGYVQHIMANKRGGMALTKLLQRPYWQRMWVFQEVVLARRATIHSGSHQADWGALLLDRISGDQCKQCVYLPIHVSTKHWPSSVLKVVTQQTGSKPRLDRRGSWIYARRSLALHSLV